MPRAVKLNRAGRPQLKLNLPTLRHHDIQQQALTDDFRFSIMPAGRRSGKTEICIQRVAHKMLYLYRDSEGTPYPATFALGAPTRPQAKDIFWHRIRNIFPDPIVYDILKGELKVILRHPTRNIPWNELRVVGLEAGHRIEGLGYDGFVIDEFANCKERVWTENIRPALADRHGWAWMIGVPQGRNHFWDLWNRYQIDPYKGAYTWHTSSVLDPEEVAEMRREMDPKMFRQECEASFEEVSGAVYYNFKRDSDVHEFPLSDIVGNEGSPWIGGMDFNVSPMTAAWGWETVEDHLGRQEKHVWIWDEISKNMSNTHAAGEMIKDKIREAKGIWEGNVFYLYPDASGRSAHTSAPAGRTDHTILKSAGFRVRSPSANPPRRDRYNSVNAMFENGMGRRRFHIHPRCKHLIRSLEGVLYAEGSNDIDKKTEAFAHITDAIGYMIHRRHKIRYAA